MKYIGIIEYEFVHQAEGIGVRIHDHKLNTVEYKLFNDKESVSYHLFLKSLEGYNVIEKTNVVQFRKKN